MCSFYAEKDFQKLKLVFKQKLIHEVEEMIEEAEPNQFDSVATEIIDARLLDLLERLLEKLHPKGLIIFVDDLHKNIEDFPVAMETHKLPANIYFRISEKDQSEHCVLRCWRYKMGTNRFTGPVLWLAGEEGEDSGYSGGPTPRRCSIGGCLLFTQIQK